MRRKFLVMAGVFTMLVAPALASESAEGKSAAQLTAAPNPTLSALAQLRQQQVQQQSATREAQPSTVGVSMHTRLQQVQDARARAEIAAAEAAAVEQQTRLLHARGQQALVGDRLLREEFALRQSALRDANMTDSQRIQLITQLTNSIQHDMRQIDQTRQWWLQQEVHFNARMAQNQRQIEEDLHRTRRERNSEIRGIFGPQWGVLGDVIVGTGVLIDQKERKEIEENHRRDHERREALVDAQREQAAATARQREELAMVSMEAKVAQLRALDPGAATQYASVLQRYAESRPY